MERLTGFSFFLEGSILTTLLLVKEKERRKKRKSATKKEKKMGGHQKVRAQFTDLRRAEYCAGRTFACFQQGEQTKKKKKKKKDRNEGGQGGEARFALCRGWWCGVWCCLGFRCLAKLERAFVLFRFSLLWTGRRLIGPNGSALYLTSAIMLSRLTDASRQIESHPERRGFVFDVKLSMTDGSRLFHLVFALAHLFFTSLLGTKK